MREHFGKTKGVLAVLHLLIPGYQGPLAKAVAEYRKKMEGNE